MKAKGHSYVAVAALSCMLIGSHVYASSGTAFTIEGKAVSLNEVIQNDQSAFYELEMKKYEKVQAYAREKYLESLWDKKAKEQGTTPELASKKYMDAAIKVSDADVTETLNRFKDHPRLSKLSAKEQKDQVTDYLKNRAANDIVEALINEGIKSGKLHIQMEKPQEPVYQLALHADDTRRFGPASSDTAPIKDGCTGEDCPIKVVEYSEFECTFCERVQADVKKLLGEYKGQLVWVVRDFPLSFHERAKPAAIAAHCAAKQGKYWDMYSALFANQRKLGDEDLLKYAQQIQLNQDKFKECTKNPIGVEGVIERNMASAMKLGVNGTPAFFINGRKLSGALPYAEFKRVFEEELMKLKKTKKS